VIASTISDVLWTGSGDPPRLRGNNGTTNTFQVMGVPPLLGRTTPPNDGRPDAELWHRLLGRLVSEYGRLCHGDGGHEGGGRCRRAFRLTILS